MAVIGLLTLLLLLLLLLLILLLNDLKTCYCRNDEAAGNIAGGLTHLTELIGIAPLALIPPVNETI